MERKPPNSKLSSLLSASKIVSFVNSTYLPAGNMNAGTLKQNNGVAVRLPNAPPADGSGITPNSSLKISNVMTLKQLNEASDALKNDSLQQLSTNALPPYVPPALPVFLQNSLLANADLHCCTDCGDTFAMKSSLTFHLERRSTLIKFSCESCSTPQIFYNRCALLSHARAHSDKGEASDIHKAVVCPLPRVFMDGINSDFVNNLENELNSSDEIDDTAPASLLELSISEPDCDEIKDQESAVENTNNSENDIVEISETKVRCFDCDQEFDSVTARKEHLTNGDRIPVATEGEGTLCNKCGILCPSKCNFKAHQRTHLQISPYICPECGESPNPYWDSFQEHMKFKCFHFSRAVGLKCPVCKRVVRNSEALQKHMELHTERYAKCDTCPRAFKSPAAFNSHKITEHDGVTVNFNIIYKCALCDIVFVTKDRMLTHKDEHLKDQVCEYIFNCMQCGKALDTKLTLLEHLKACHMKTYRMNVCDDSTLKPKVNSSEYKGRVECILCNCSFLSHQGYSVHMARSHTNSKIRCNFCFIVMPNRKEMIMHGKKHLQKGNFLCLLCHNMRCEQRSSFITHLHTHVDKLKYCTFCPICDEELRTAKIALAHLRVEHFLLPNPDDNKKSVEKDVVTIPIEVPTRVSCHFCRVMFDNDASLKNHLVKEHSRDVKSKTENGKAENGHIAAEPLPKRQRPSEDTCAKCNFKSSDRIEFKKHILIHKTNKSTFQCQDCGLCFVVQPSLTKHLKITHKVYDVKKYIEEEGTNFSPEKKKLTDSPTYDALMCTVCATSFPTESALKTHMRSHGMAFIQAKKSITF